MHPYWRDFGTWLLLWASGTLCILNIAILGKDLLYGRQAWPSLDTSIRVMIPALCNIQYALLQFHQGGKGLPYIHACFFVFFDRESVVQVAESNSTNKWARARLHEKN